MVMKQLVLIIALVITALFTTSAFNEARFGTAPGETLPPLTLSDGSRRVNLADARGEYVLLSFWTSEDAASRELCHRYSVWSRKNSGKIQHIAVNFDSHRPLFESIVKADGLDQANQFNVSGKAAEKIKKDFKIDGNCGTLLIAPDGTVAAINPDDAALAAL